MTTEERRIYNKFGLTPVERNLMGDTCNVCGGTSKKRRLHVDHDHTVPRLPIKSYRVLDGWAASCAGITVTHHKRNIAIRKMRLKLRKLSVRGILCFPCNGGLRKFRDNPAFLEAAANYLRKYHELIGFNPKA